MLLRLIMGDVKNYLANLANIKFLVYFYFVPFRPILSIQITGVDF